MSYILLQEARVANECFSTLTLGLAEQVSELQSLCLLRAADSSSTLATMKMVAKQVQDVERKLSSLEGKVQAELAVAQQARDLALALRSQKLNASKLTAVIPPTTSSSRTESPTHEREVSQIDQVNEQESDSGHEEREEERDEEEQDCEYVSVPSEAELKQVPKYMRGRLTIDKLEAACESINRAFQYKERVLQLPRSKQSVAVREKVLTWREQSTAELDGLLFVTIDDIIEQKEVDINSLKSALQVLRFLGFLRLSGQNGVGRYCVQKC